NIGSEIKHLLQNSGRQVENQSHTAGDALKVPDMGNRGRKLDMAHALSADAGLGHFHATSVADNAFISDLFVFSAVTLPVLGRPKNALAEQSVALRLER